MHVREHGWMFENFADIMCRMVMNVGRRPTVNEGNEQNTVEVHLMHPFSKDFYGQVGASAHATRHPTTLPSLA